MHFDVVGTDDPIGSEVLAFEVRVDRHVMLGAASTDGGHEVDRCHPTLLLDEGSRLWSQHEFHTFT